MKEVKLKLYLLVLLGALFGCASNGYLEPSSGATAQFSFENIYDGEVSKSLLIKPFASIFKNSSNCTDPQFVKRSNQAGIKLAAESLVTMSAGFNISYPNIQRGTVRQALFSFVPKAAGNYKLLIDYDDDLSSVSLTLMNLDSGEVEPIKQRKIVLNLKAGAFSTKGCDENYQNTEYSNEIYAKDTVMNPIPEYGYTDDQNAKFATIETKIKAFDLLRSGISSNNLSIYDNPKDCSSFKTVKSGGVKSKVPVDQELVLYDLRKHNGAFCSVLFAFRPEAGKSYNVKTTGGLFRTCGIEVIDSLSQKPVDIYKKKIDRTSDIPVCVDVHKDGNKKKYQKNISYWFM